MHEVLRRTEARDLDDLLALWNDGRVMRWVGFPEGLGWSRAKAAAWFGKISRDPTRHHLVVEEPELGFRGEAFCRVDLEHRRAELDIKLRPEVQGRGVATAALGALISVVFEQEPGVDAVWTEPSRVNRRARRLYRRCGLRPCRRPADLPPWESYWERRRG